MTISPQQQDLTVLIPAAGMGRRLGLGPKALLELAGKPLIYWVTQKALALTDDVVVAIPPNSHAQFAKLCPGCRLIEGGATRRESIAHLANASEREFVLIHAVAFPFASLALLQAVAYKARAQGAAASFVKPDVPLAKIENGLVSEELWHSHAGIFQAPQAYKRELLLQALAATDQTTDQSTVQMLLNAGVSVAAVAGEKSNIKLTTPEDWRFAQTLLDLLAPPSPL